MMRQNGNEVVLEVVFKRHSQAGRILQQNSSVPTTLILSPAVVSYLFINLFDTFSDYCAHTKYSVYAHQLKLDV